METKANYLLIGAFTVLGFLGLLGFVAWFAKIELDRRFAYYEVYFPNVSGLDRASTVKFAGLAVGQVADLDLAKSGDGTVRVLLEVDANTPVRQSSVATIEAQGVTGVSFVGISAGDPDDPRLRGNRARIEAGKSALQTLTQDAPKIIDQALTAMERVNAILSPENEAKVTLILDNLASSSDQLDATLRDFSIAAGKVSASVENIADFTERLEGMTTSVENTLGAAEKALEAIDSFAADAKVTLEAGTRLFEQATGTVDIAGRFIDNDLAAMVQDFTVTSATFRVTAEDLRDQARRLLVAWADAGDATTARLTEAQQLFVQAEAGFDQLSKTLSTIDTAADGFDLLMREDAPQLLEQTRATMEDAQRALTPLADAAENDLPQIFADLRATSETVRQSAAQLEQDLSGIGGRVDTISAQAATALEEAADTFARARVTLEQIDTTLSAANSSLAAAEGAFVGAQRIVDQDLTPITEGLRGTVTRLNGALDQVSADIPDISDSLQSAADNAAAAGRRLGAMIERLDAPLSDFADNGLPQYTRLGREARALVDVLSSISAQIERDPARFFLGGDTPRYRR